MTETEFKKLLWDSANKLRGAMSAAEYKFPVLGLVFLKYISDIFEAQREVIRVRFADPESACPSLSFWTQQPESQFLWSCGARSSSAGTRTLGNSRCTFPTRPKGQARPVVP
jgi:hypothetical protein